MTSLFSSPKIPAPTPTPPTPTPVDQVVQQAAADQRAALASATGRASTILTSGQGALASPPTMRKQLLGAA